MATARLTEADLGQADRDMLDDLMDYHFISDGLACAAKEAREEILADYDGGLPFEHDDIYDAVQESVDKIVADNKLERCDRCFNWIGYFEEGTCTLCSGQLHCVSQNGTVVNMKTGESVGSIFRRKGQ